MTDTAILSRSTKAHIRKIVAESPPVSTQVRAEIIRILSAPGKS